MAHFTTVFLSSTAKDLQPWRDAAAEAISKLAGFHCVRMENFGAVDSEPAEFCRRKVAESEVFVGLVGHLYGSSPEGSELSFTQIEYEEATRTGKPRLLFMADDDFPLPAKLLREVREQEQRQVQFRDQVKRERSVVFFNDPQRLATLVVAALQNHQEGEARATFSARDIEGTALPEVPKQEGASAGPITPAAEVNGLAPTEAVEQFRGFYHHLAGSVGWAIDFLYAGICVEPAQALEGPKAIISQLIRELLLPVLDHLNQLDSLIITGDWTRQRFDEVLNLARRLLNGDYCRLTAWINLAGKEILSEEELVSAGGYVELRYRHWELFLEARRIRRHSLLGGIVPLLNDLERNFPGLARQESMNYIGEMTARELHAHIRREGGSQFIGRQWAQERMKIIDWRTEEGQMLSVNCMTNDGYALVLEKCNIHELANLLRPGKQLDAFGTIKSIANSITLLPSEVYRIESDP